MGLDMYLEKDLFLSYYTTNATVPFTLNTINGTKTIQVNLKDKKIQKITFSVMYWRKANAIHKWFVDNVQDGNDDCSRYWVSKEKLEQLLEICKKVEQAYENENLSKEEKEEQISSLLPTQEGFFFGTYAYDSYYIQDVKDTIEALEKEINSPDYTNNEFSYYYQSSW